MLRRPRRVCYTREAGVSLRMMMRRTRHDLSYYIFPDLADAGARHAVSTRSGGVSAGRFAALNLGYSVGDDPLAVQHNRRLLYSALDVNAADVTSCHQVHSADVALVRDADRGRGALDTDGIIPATDALITQSPDLYLFQRYADCTPIFFCDPRRRAVGLAHAGWKGTVGQIVCKTVAAMQQTFRSEVEHIRAAIGPGIGPCHYEIREDVATRVRAALPFWRDVLREEGGRLMLDLAAANRRLLLSAGLRESNVVVSGICTACHTDAFYSHRAEQGSTGRFGALIAWVGGGAAHG